ncbi:hypothetical protein [Pseudomonas migulae]
MTPTKDTANVNTRLPIMRDEPPLLTKPAIAKPQVYYGMSFDNISKDLILSIDEHGQPLSKLSDLIWEMTQFKLVITDNITYSFSGLKCKKTTNSENIFLVQIFFLMRMFSNKGATKTLRASSQFGGLYSLLYLCRYADDHDILIRDLVHRPDLYKPMLASMAHARASVLWQILRIFNITKCPNHWFLIPNAFMKALKNVYRGTSHKSKKQHPVIPPRILNLRWGRYHEVLEDFKQHRTQLTEFLQRAASNRLYARGTHSQYMIKKLNEVSQDAAGEPDFDEAARMHGLDHLFRKYKILDVSFAPSFLGMAQYCAKALVHILTFMRSGEALLLEHECLEKATGWCEEGVYVVGISTKSTGRAVDTRWITTEHIQTPLQTLVEIYEIIHPYLPNEHKGIKNFFIAPTHIPITKRKEPVLFNKCISFKYETRLPPIPIEEEDLFCLELIDPSRDWRSEKKFQIGKPWSFTTHQFRRTMTVYCAEDDLMDIAPLKRVLGHLSGKTSEHYQKGCSAGLMKMSEWSPEMVAEFKEAALDASNAIYIRDILYSEEKLHGVEGRRIQNDKDKQAIVLEETIDQLLIRKKKGLIACATTPVGLCLSIQPCEKRAHADFSTCDGCSESVIKLSKLDYTIEVLRFDLETLDPGSVEYRMDAQNLQDLEKMRDRLVAKAD